MDEREDRDETKQMEEAARSARQRLWAADVSCYYAQRRFSQTDRAADRRIWQDCQRETEEAVATVREAERALARARAGRS